MRTRLTLGTCDKLWELTQADLNPAQAPVLHVIENFVNWDAGKADFCRQDFYEILEFAGSESGWAKAAGWQRGGPDRRGQV